MTVRSPELEEELKTFTLGGKTLAEASAPWQDDQQYLFHLEGAYEEAAQNKLDFCTTCRRHTQHPGFDGCMNEGCSRGYEPCF